MASECPNNKGKGKGAYEPVPKGKGKGTPTSTGTHEVNYDDWPYEVEDEPPCNHEFGETGINEIKNCVTVATTKPNQRDSIARKHESKTTSGGRWRSPIKTSNQLQVLQELCPQEFPPLIAESNRTRVEPVKPTKAWEPNQVKNNRRLQETRKCTRATGARNNEGAKELGK